MLKFITVTKSFGDIIALSDINLEIEPGEFVYITGPSGAGKTTLLNLVLRKYLPDNGEIMYGDTDITKLRGGAVSKLRQKIGVVFQDFKVLPERTVTENIEVALAVQGVADREWRERVRQVLDMVGLSERATLFPAQLSGGELQRVAIARALVVGPDLILADEPTGNLDWETADNIMQILDRINKEGKTVVIATHHKGITDKMKRRMVSMHGGKIDSDSKNPAAKNAESEKEKEDKKEGGETVKVEVTEV